MSKTVAILYDVLDLADSTKMLLEAKGFKTIIETDHRSILLGKPIKADVAIIHLGLFVSRDSYDVNMAKVGRIIGRLGRNTRRIFSSSHETTQVLDTLLLAGADHYVNIVLGNASERTLQFAEYGKVDSNEIELRGKQVWAAEGIILPSGELKRNPDFSQEGDDYFRRPKE